MPVTAAGSQGFRLGRCRRKSQSKGTIIFDVFKNRTALGGCPATTTAILLLNAELDGSSPELEIWTIPESRGRQLLHDGIRLPIPEIITFENEADTTQKRKVLGNGKIKQ